MSDNETMNGYNKQNFQAGDLLTADQMSNIDSGLYNAFARIKELEEKINSGNLGNGNSGTESGNGSTITNIDEIKITILKSIYPIGSIYVGNIYSELKNKTPKEILGFGTWEQIKDRFLYAAGDENEAGTLGGEAEHTLTIDEMPSHNHSPFEVNEEGTDTNYKRCFMTALHTNSDSTGRSEVARGASSGINTIVATNVEDLLAKNSITSSTGGDIPHNNMPPYLTIYMWQRVQDRFFITGQEYKVEEGMTWAEWCNKEEYNTTEFSITDEGYISYADDYIALNDEKVKGDSLIILDTNYFIIQDKTQSA